MSLLEAVRDACTTYAPEPAVRELASGRVVTYAELGRLLDGADAQPGLHVETSGEDVDTLVRLLARSGAGGSTLLLNPAAGPAVHAALRAAARGWVPRDDVHLVPTSGSSGTPRLVRLTQQGILAATQVYLDRVPLEPGWTTACPMSFASVGALPSAVLPALLTGGTALLCAGATPRAFADALVRHDVRFATSYAAWWETCLSLPGFSAPLHTLAVGGAPWQHLLPRIRTALPAARALGIYGLTETHGPGVHGFGDEPAVAAGASGRPARGLEVELRDGEVWLRGGLVAPGYVGGGMRRDADGWLGTGDEGELDAEGRLTVLGRRDDVLNLGGRKVHPLQVESVLAAHPGVVRCAVVRRGDALAAYVIGSARPDELRAWVREQVAAYAAPREVHLVDALPLLANGKVDRGALRG
ncbi:O-succinylbenzoic acid--CoA ligase [Motilibacter rhizosphaerae]|uniref:O-succinylbenzoic acid--CoA ligase n=1 Tax=Motilibacter rhizosphaerae TaxID=598652 RepID=A0A4Q7NQD1_9ACTN|nr:fatty acid--CoA ligase family protein [Motilibacter rhizosphaerae]RZS87544.1 O-succinylbenzoic acid--CoA ligase [Motilibacter rhizosphaerae]